MIEQNRNEIEQAPAVQTRAGLLGEPWDFFRESKQGSLPPIWVALLVRGGRVILAGSGLAPFIPTLS